MIKKFKQFNRTRLLNNTESGYGVIVANLDNPLLNGVENLGDYNLTANSWNELTAVHRQTRIDKYAQHAMNVMKLKKTIPKKLFGYCEIRLLKILFHAKIQILLRSK